jgi:microcystin-dependent protein
MYTVLRKSALSVALAAGLIGSATWSPSSQACAYEPVLASVCVLAAANMGDFNNTFAVANGRTLAISQFTALYSLIGTAYGGNGTSNFNLPDLRGRMIVGAGTGTGLPTFVVGEIGGQTAVTLTVNQLPQHTHSLAGATVTLGTLAATTTLTGLSATASASGLTLNGSSGGTLDNNPSGKSLGTTITAQGKIYSDATPTVAMKAGSIGGSIAVGNFTGNPTTTLSGAPALSGNTGPAGQGLPVPTMPPFVAMTYYIATQGVYPSRN